jgi:protein phosphatase
VITRVLGTDPEVDVDTVTVETRAGDLFLLCSDGLYSMVGNERILELVERHRGDLKAVAKALIAAANKVGGDDNITVVAFEIGERDGEGTNGKDSPTAVLDPADEDTLTEVDRVPAVTTMVVAPEDIDRHLGSLQQSVARSGEVEGEPGDVPAALRPLRRRRRSERLPPFRKTASSASRLAPPPKSGTRA